MLLAAILLLTPNLQRGASAEGIREIPAAISSDSLTISSLSEPLPPAPEPKVKTDAEAAGGAELAEAGPIAPAAVEPAVQPHPSAASFVAMKRASANDYDISQNQRRLWYALAFTGHGAAVFDAWSTRRAISQGYGVEGNPLLRPFSHSGAMYAATQVSPLVMDFIGKRMMMSRHPLLRRIWWLPQAAGSGMSFAAGIHNMGLVP